MMMMILSSNADTDSPYPYASEIHDESFARRKQRRNRTTFTLQQVTNRISQLESKTFQLKTKQSFSDRSKIRE